MKFIDLGSGQFINANWITSFKYSTKVVKQEPQARNGGSIEVFPDAVEHRLDLVFAPECKVSDRKLEGESALHIYGLLTS